jgi:hypothetical protein
MQPSTAVLQGATRVCRPCFSGHVREQRKFNREQKDLEVRGGFSIANQSGSVVSSQKSTTPSNSYLSSIVRARPRHLKKAREPSHRALPIANLVHRGNSLSA